MKSLFLKFLLPLVLALGLLLTISPKVIGFGVEQATVESLLALIPPEAENQLEIRRKEFSNGWFSSTATIELLYTALGADSIALILDFDINHGPLLQTENGLKIGLAYARIEADIRNRLFDMALADLSFPLPELDLDLLVRFDQSLLMTMQLGEITYTDTLGEVNFTGLSANISVNPDQSAQASINMGVLSALEHEANSNILLSGMRLTSHTEQINDLLAASDAELVIPSISSTSPLAFSLSDLRVVYGLRGSPTVATESEVVQTISIANIDGDLPLRSFRWESEIKQLNNNLLRDYYRMLNELQAELNTDTDAVSEELTQLGMQLALLLLQNPLQLNNLIQTNAYDGDHRAELRIQWAGLSDLADVSALDTRQALAALDITLDISLHLEAILRSPLSGLIDPYVQQGYLTVSNGRVVIQASLQNSVLKINGDQLPLDQFL
jgi:uncharacterized protein YdgA (DUF945 family)